MSKILDIEEWHTVASEYDRRQVGNYRITDCLYRPGLYPYYFMDGNIFFRFKKTERLTLLQEQRDGEWHDWMIDSPMDVMAMEKYAERAEGDVLCGGLGLGIIAHKLANNRKVKSITIVELSPEVIELTGKYLPLVDVRVVQEDFWQFTKQDDGKWGMVIVDIWSTKGRDQHRKVFKEQVIPANTYIRQKYPESVIVFHGFAEITDVPLVEPYFKENKKV